MAATEHGAGVSRVLYGAEHFINKAKVKESEVQNFNLDYKDGKYEVNGKPFAASVRPPAETRRSRTRPVEPEERQPSHHNSGKDSPKRKSSHTRNASSGGEFRGGYDSRDSRKSDSRTSSSRTASRTDSRVSSASRDSRKSDSRRSDPPKPRVIPVQAPPKETPEQRHQRVIETLVGLEVRGITIKDELFRRENVSAAEDFIRLSRAKVKIHGKLEMISGLLYGSSLALEQSCKLVGFSSMDGWATQVQKSEAELGPAAEEVYDKYFNEDTSPELKFASIYLMTMFRHTASQKALSLLREIEAMTEMDTIRTRRMQGLTDDDAIGGL